MAISLLMILLKEIKKVKESQFLGSVLSRC